MKGTEKRDVQLPFGVPARQFESSFHRLCTGIAKIDPFGASSRNQGRQFFGQ